MGIDWRLQLKTACLQPRHLTPKALPCKIKSSTNDNSGDFRELGSALESDFRDWHHFGRAHIPNGRAHIPNGRAHIPNGRARIPNGRAHIPNGRARIPNGRIHIPMGEMCPVMSSETPVIFTQHSEQHGKDPEAQN
jgi:hypothetical protein